MKYLRQRKDGGISLCSASPENVGKKRCCHILSGELKIYSPSRKENFVDIESSKFTEYSNKEVRKALSLISNRTNKQEKELILAVLR